MPKKTALVVDQNVRKVLACADRGVVIDLGTIRLRDRASTLLNDERVADLYLGRGVKATT